MTTTEITITGWLHTCQRCGRRVIVVNQDGTRSAELTSLLTDIGGMLIKWWTWESDGSGVGTSGF